LVNIQNISGGDSRYYYNIFAGDGLNKYDNTKLPMQVDGNIYLNGAKHYAREENFIEKANSPNIRIEEEGESVYLYFTFDKDVYKLKNSLVTTALLGKAVIPDQAFENPDGSPLQIDTDYFGNKREKRNPTAGPFEMRGKEEVKL